MINKVEISGVNTSKLPVLSNEEKAELFIKIKNGDELARQKFINGNLRLVLSVIQRFRGRGELAERQSVAIMRVFRAMREYISQHRQLVPQQELLLLSGKQALLESKVRDIKENMVTRAELSDFMRLFDSRIEHEEILILDGEPFKADVAYQKIYGKAKRKIIIVDDYIGVKTLLHLAHAKANAVLTVISDNKARPPLRQAEYHDYLTENPGRNITFIQSAGRSHDRYIVLDEGTMDMKVYHCGASSKDAGKKITTITRLTDIDDYKNTIHTLLGNPPLVLR